MKPTTTSLQNNGIRKMLLIDAQKKLEKNKAEMKSQVNSIFCLKLWKRQTTFVIEIPDSFTILPCIYVSKPFKSPPLNQLVFTTFQIVFRMRIFKWFKRPNVFMLLQVGAETAFVNQNTSEYKFYWP